MLYDSDVWHCLSRKSAEQKMAMEAKVYATNAPDATVAFRIEERPAHDQKGRPFTDYVVIQTASWP